MLKTDPLTTKAAHFILKENRAFILEKPSDTPLVTIAILVRNYPHLLSLSIDSILAQKCPSYEIVVLEVGARKEIVEQINFYRSKIAKVYSVHEDHLARLMNRALLFAKGKYIHFLFAGDTYLSRYCIEEMNRLVLDKKDPDIIYSSFLQKQQEANPFVVFRPLSDQILKKGKLPAPLQSLWFSTKLIRKMEGIDEKYKHRPVFNFFCRAMLKKKCSIIAYQRVLVDCMMRRRGARGSFNDAMETFLIIYQNFGIFPSLIWWFSRDRLQLLRFMYLSVKKVFLEPR